MTCGSATLIAEARTWVGVPFLHQGRSRDGVDCIGLIVETCRACGVLPIDFSTGVYGRVPAHDMLRTRIAAHCERLPSARVGSLVVIRWAREASHVALCLGETLVHAYERVGRVVEHGYRGRWVRMTDSAWALPGIEY
jgi:cell wall-associated NlpC family hydrolase